MDSCSGIVKFATKQEEEETEKMGEGLFFLGTIFLFSFLAEAALFSFAVAAALLFILEWKMISFFLFVGGSLALFFAYQMLRSLNRRVGAKKEP